jgi:hypothetical protein
MSMNTLLFQMIAARANNSSDSSVAQVLARLNVSSGSNPIPDPQQLFAQFGGGNPLLSALGKHFTEIQSNGSGHTTGSIIDVEPQAENEEAIDRSNELSEKASTDAVNELREDVKVLSAELKALRDRNDLLAATLGACCLCWGQDPECRFCRGRGRPGFTLPDEAHIGEFVLPAIQRLRAERAKNICSTSPLANRTYRGAGA